MDIKATSISIFDFFTKEEDSSLKDYVSSKIEVPSFQRNYAWDTKHIKELIESIDENKKGYYVGNILIQNSRGSSSRDLIIDGQQRLTTIFLILKALEQIGLRPQKKKLLEEVVFYNKAKKILRIDFTRKNLSSSFTSIVESNDLSPENFPDENSKKFFANYNFIKKQLLSLGDLNLFFDKVINIVFVVIKFNEGFDVNQLFEGLNSKGKILSSVQLTKNALIGSSKEGGDVDAIISNWEEIESSFEKSKKIIWFDKFLRHSGFYKYGYVSNTNLFKEIKKDIKEKGDLLKFSSNLKEDALLYLTLRKGDVLKSDISSSISEGDWNMISSIIKHISTMDIDQVYGVLFASFKYSKIDNSYIKGKNSRFLRDLKRVWFFSIMVKFLDTKPSLFERDFAEFANNLRLGEYKESRKLFDKLKNIIVGSNKDKFVSNLGNRIKITGKNDKKVTSKNNRNFVTPLLLLYLTDGADFIIKDHAIEHIIPKGSLGKWTIGAQFISEVKKSSRYKIGNLTLLKKDETKDLDFNSKLIFYKKDFFEKNKSLGEYKKEFCSVNPTEGVERRGTEIGNLLYDLLKKNI